jgi:hypothetical protein
MTFVSEGQNVANVGSHLKQEACPAGATEIMDHRMETVFMTHHRVPG